jgi:hypothetical protein
MVCSALLEILPLRFSKVLAGGIKAGEVGVLPCPHNYKVLWYNQPAD